ncbi:sensor domain-containing diguanylate cyclase [Sulfurimonas marina]|uniref:diguanylate cyclase n=1 Tax=Sulfurimonas marina TaxID=2590551 RepID=A0A7M1AVD9_9BACT|nr:sensor domain-containing diguanylate cyclase [Sulfurimonas marina]QOP41407.1 GGDEF domain-containing protein [Sulfurimonas marina]
MTEHHFDNEAIVEGELQLFRTLWHTSNDNLFIVRRDTNGEYISEKSNRSLEQTFHLLPNQMDGIALKEILDETTYKKIIDRYDECIKKNKPVTYEEKHLIDESGERFWITTILPVTDQESGIIRILGVSREITPIRKAEQTLQELNEKLEQKVIERTKELTIALQQMEKLSITDKLTNLYNRYKIEEVLNSEIHRAQRYDTHFGLLMLDIDKFKNINDNYGHIQGDKILQEFSNILKNYIRESDSVGRWGGEEFLVITPISSQEAIITFADRLRKVIEEHNFDTVGNITVSIGATIYQKGSTIESLIAKADNGLYASKNNGRNSVHYQ